MELNEEKPPGVRVNEVDKHIVQRDTRSDGCLYRDIVGAGTSKKGCLIFGNLHHAGSFRPVNLV